MNIVRGRLKAADVIPPGRRYNPECDCIETSPDGGTTWVEDPAADPRTNPANLLPPRTTGDPRCDAAEAMMQHFKAQVDAFLAGSSVWTIVSVFIPLLFFIPGVNVFITLLFEIVSGLFAIGTEVVDAAMTEAVYEQMMCIFYCHIGDDGQMSAEQLAAVQSDIDTLIGGTPNLVFDLFAGLWTEIVFSNAGAVGEYTGDCTECVCVACHEFDFTVSDLGFVAQDVGFIAGNYESGLGWETYIQNDGCNNHGYIYLHANIGGEIDNIDRIEFDFNGHIPDMSVIYFDQCAENGSILQRTALGDLGGNNWGAVVSAPFAFQQWGFIINRCDTSFFNLARVRVYWSAGTNGLSENC